MVTLRPATYRTVSGRSTVPSWLKSGPSVQMLTCMTKCCVNPYYVTLASLLQILPFCFIVILAFLERSVFLSSYLLYSTFLVLYIDIFYVTFAIILFPFWECSMSLDKHVRFKIQNQFIGIFPFVMLPQFTKTKTETEKGNV